VRCGATPARGVRTRLPGLCAPQRVRIYSLALHVGMLGSHSALDPIFLTHLSALGI
jgi:hypothetical protein